MMFMAKFIPKGKMSKKAQKELNRQRRVTWDFSPVTKTVDSRKIYSRKRKAQNREDYGLSFFYTGLYWNENPDIHIIVWKRTQIIPAC